MFLPQTRSWTGNCSKHRLLDAEKVMGLFTSSADIFFIAPSGELYKGRDQVRQTWVRFFAGLQSIHGDIDHISYLPASDGVIAVGQVTYYRQLKGPRARQAHRRLDRFPPQREWEMGVRLSSRPLALGRQLRPACF
jgi:hypothetical protein